MDLENSRKVAYLMRQGLTSAESGDLGPAAEYFEQAVRLSPDFYAPYYNLGCIYFKMGRPEDACKVFQIALERSGNDSRILNNLALTLQELDHIPEAEGLYRQLLDLDPLHELAHYNLGRLLFERGKYRAAISHWVFVSQDSPAWHKAVLNLAIAFGRLKKWPKSLQYLSRVAHFWTGDLDFHIARAQAYEALHQRRLAYAEWRRVAELSRDPNTRAFARTRRTLLFVYSHQN